jgi:hypothetical protein
LSRGDRTNAKLTREKVDMASSTLIFDRAKAQYDCSEQLGQSALLPAFLSVCWVGENFRMQQLEVKKACVLEGKTRLGQT